MKKIVVVKVMMSHSSMKLGKFDILIFFSEQSPNPKSLQNASKATFFTLRSDIIFSEFSEFTFNFVGNLIFFSKFSDFFQDFCFLQR